MSRGDWMEWLGGYDCLFINSKHRAQWLNTVWQRVIDRSNAWSRLMYLVGNWYDFRQTGMKRGYYFRQEGNKPLAHVRYYIGFSIDVLFFWYEGRSQRVNKISKSKLEPDFFNLTNQVRFSRIYHFYWSINSGPKNGLTHQRHTGKFSIITRRYLSVAKRASLARNGVATLRLSFRNTSKQNHIFATLSSNKPREKGKSLNKTWPRYTHDRTVIIPSIRE